MLPTPLATGFTPPKDPKRELAQVPIKNPVMGVGRNMMPADGAAGRRETDSTSTKGGCFDDVLVNEDGFNREERMRS